MAIEIHAPQGHVDVVSHPNEVSVTGRNYNVDIVSSPSSGGTKNYERLTNKPRIEDVELIGNKELEDFGMDLATNYDIAMLFK